MSITTIYGVTLTVEIALSAATGTSAAWDAGTWDSSTWGPDEIWVDVTQWVRSIQTDRAFSRDVAAWESGTATIVLDNRDGRFSPLNLAGPYVTAGVTGVRPWRPVRVRAAYGGTTYNVYRGYATAFEETYSAVHGPGTGDVEVSVPCVDEMGALARFDGLEQVPAGASETSGARIHRILDNAGHTGDRNIAAGNVTMQATTLAQNTVTELKLTADSEGGALYIGPDGAVIFEHNYALIENPRSNTIQWAFGDQGGGQLAFSDIETHYDGDLLTNIAAFARVGGTTQTSTNEPSRALYRDKRYTRTDLISETDLQVANLADFYVQQFGQPEVRITRVEVTPTNNGAALFPAALGVLVRDMVEVIRQMPGGFTIDQLCHVSGVHHRIDLDNWVTNLDLFSAAVYQGVGRWDDAIWDVSTWFY